jgi:hypothetical protein
MRGALLAVVLAACGGPALQNAPHPNNAAMAGGFAALAGAATLASPHDAAKKAEGEKGVPAEAKPQKVKEHVPASAFDHLDEQEAKGSGSAEVRDDDETRGAPMLVPPR